MTNPCLSEDIQNIINYFKQPLSDSNEASNHVYDIKNLTSIIENHFTSLTLNDSLVDINVKLAVSIHLKNVINDQVKMLSVYDGKKLLQKVLEYLCQHNSFNNKIYKEVLLCIKPLIHLINN